MTDDEELLRGGVANTGAVVRAGLHVLRPSGPHTASIHRLLTGIRERGFAGAPKPVGLEPDGRERLEFEPGDVPLPPYPDWAQTDAVLASIAPLLRRLHDASEQLDLAGCSWSTELADRVEGPVICHNDVCLENVVFRDGAAAVLLDFEFAAPGRRTFDLATLARMCVPVDDDFSAARLGWLPADRPARLRLVADAYGLDGPDRSELITVLDETIARGGEFVRRRVEAGEPGFVAMWEQMGGQERYDRRRRWWLEHRAEFGTAMV